MVESTKKRKI